MIAASRFEGLARMPPTSRPLLDFAWQHAWIPVLLLVLAGLFAGIRLKGRRIKGWVGEKAVRLLLDAHGVEHLHDVYLPTRNGITQVDHVALVGGTILVIETKNYEGVIDPKHGSIAWTQVLAGGRVKNRFQSPLEQNRGHVRAVRLAGGAVAAVEGLVVFAGGARFPKGMPRGVVTVTGLPAELRRVKASRRPDAEAVAAWERVKAIHAATDRDQSKRVHLETVAKARARAAERKAA